MKKNAGVTEPTAKIDLTYSNSELELVNVGITNGGTWQYKLAGGTYSTTIPTAINAGTYTVYYKLVGGDSYNDIAETSVNVTIAAKALSNDMIDTISSQTYSGSALTPAITVKNGVITLTKDSDYTVSYENNTNVGTATVTVTGQGNYTGNASKTFTINKATQTAPSAPGAAIVSSNSVTLEAVSAGHGNTMYGYSTTNDASTVTNWQEGVEFTGLTANTTYYFFAKYEGDTNYNEVVSEGAEIKTMASSFTINTPTLSSNVTANSNNPTTIKVGETATLTFTASERSTFATILPEKAVSGAVIKSWDSSTGTLVIENATNNVDISLLLPVVETSNNDGIISVSSTGTNLTYQWYTCDDANYKNAKEYANVTNSFDATSFNGYCFCVVSNEYGSSKTTILID